MCGRFTLFAAEEEIMQTFQLDEPIEHYERSFNIAPGQEVLAIIHDGTKRRAGKIRWGLVPSWAKNEKIGYRMINARSETAHEKPSFKNLMAQKRCLIIADSFYEWKDQQPYRIQVKERKLFAFAGLWDKWEKGGKKIFTCTILTKKANQTIQNLHHRMPIILPQDMEDQWTQPTFQHPKKMKLFLDQIVDTEFHYYPVSTYVNKASNNGRECIDPIVEQ